MDEFTDEPSRLDLQFESRRRGIQRRYGRTDDQGDPYAALNRIGPVENLKKPWVMDASASAAPRLSGQ